MSLLDQVKDHLKSLGASPKRALGQNFLVDEYIIQKIIDRVKRLKSEQLIEVGPGLGALTEPLQEFKLPLTLIELDQSFAKMWREQSIDVVEEDALKINWNALQLKEPTTFVSNLPYQISSSLVIEMSLGPLEIKNMVLMFQKEVAQRITAKPKTKAYGLLSVIAQTYWDVFFVLDAAPACFYPPPKVASRVLHFQRKRSHEDFSRSFLKFVKKAFAQRRKFLVKNLGNEVQPEDLESMGINPKVRAEELSPEQFQSLFQLVSKKRGN